MSTQLVARAAIAAIVACHGVQCLADPYLVGVRDGKERWKGRSVRGEDWQLGTGMGCGESEGCLRLTSFHALLEGLLDELGMTCTIRSPYCVSALCTQYVHCTCSCNVLVPPRLVCCIDEIHF